VPEFFTDTPALTSHADVLSTIQLIKEFPHITREQLVQRRFGQGVGVTNTPAKSDTSRAINIAASVVLLTNCGMWNEGADLLEDGSQSLPWHDNVSANDFVAVAFPSRLHEYFITTSDEYRESELKASLSAKDLKDKAGLHVESTDDLRCHLELNLGKRVVYVYHNTAVLKEMLLISRSDGEACLVPRRLVLEVLHTIHNILFPSDQDSQAFLSFLVMKRGFDQDLTNYESARYQRTDDPEPSYHYFGARLAELYDELQNPTPRTRLESWFERKSGARYMLMATMIGVFIAVILGILGLGISGFQAYVSYQQWKHPVKDV
jgi:hypothetical protein